MDLSVHYREFTDALLHAFNQGELVRLVAFTFNANLNAIVNPGPLIDRVFEFIGWCDGEGKVDELFLAALKEKPGNPKLKALAKKLANEVDSIHLSIETAIKEKHLNYKDYATPDADTIRKELSVFEANGALQALVVNAPHLSTGQDVVEWRKRMDEARTRICWIGQGDVPKGTGFLIGSDRVMTCSHVVESGTHLAFDVVFDYLGQSARGSLPKYKFANELVRSLPRELDFVIFQLNQKPTGQRAYFKITPYQFDRVREPVSVLGHAGGRPLSVAYGVVFDNNSFMRRLAYTANTEGGSSGSPVFLEDWSLAAIHHHGETGVNNHGIPMKEVLSLLSSQGKAALLEKAN